MTLHRFIFLVFFWITGVFSWSQKYYVYVAAESEDQVALVSYDGFQARVEEEVKVGFWPKEIEGPHGLTVSPDGKFWFLSLAHGQPYGTVFKYTTGSNELVGQTQLGLFPATMQVSKATGLLYVVNFNLHGEMVPSTVSVVDPDPMIELARIETGVMPHGSRLNPEGTKHYSLAMMSGELFEIDALTFSLDRILPLDEVAGMSNHHDHEGHSQGGEKHHDGMDHEDMKHSDIKPTWVVSHPDGKRLYIAGNGSDEILEIDIGQWDVIRRFSTGKGPYNVEVTADGKTLVSTYKSEGSTGIWDLDSGIELARITNTRKVSHGIALTPDNKFAFVSVEGIGGEPGTVDIISLDKLEIVDYVEIGKQAGGIAFWKMGD